MYNVCINVYILTHGLHSDLHENYECNMDHTYHFKTNFLFYNSILYQTIDLQKVHNRK